MAQSSLVSAFGAFLAGKKGQAEVECCNVLHVVKHRDVDEGLLFFSERMMAPEPTVKLLTADAGPAAVGLDEGQENQEKEDLLTMLDKWMQSA